MVDSSPSVATAAYRPWAVACVAMLAGCTVLPIDTADAIRKRGDATFDRSDYLATLSPATVADRLSARAVPIDRLRGPDFSSLAVMAGGRITADLSGDAITEEALVLAASAAGPAAVA